MSIYQPSISNALGPGVYGVNVKPAATLPAEGTGVCCLVEEMPWGPSQVLYEPTDTGDQILTYYPPGMSRNLPGPLALSGKGWPTLFILRVTAASGTVKASAIFPSSVPANILTVTLKYTGAAGNAAVGTISPASDGNTNHVDLTVVVTGASGTTRDFVPNLNVSGVGADYLGADVLPNCRLIGTIAKDAAGIPAAGSVAFTAGADGSVVAADYVGTQGFGDKGLAATETETSINHIFFGNVSANASTCNTGLQQHAIFMGSRMAYAAGIAGQTAAQAQTDVAAVGRADQFVYVDPWMQQISDQDSTTQTIPAPSMCASVAAQLSPSTKISWRDPEVAALMSACVGVESQRGSQALTNSKAGIVTLIKKKGGGFAFYTDATSNAPVNTGAPTIADTRMSQYILSSAEDGFQTNVNGPNVPATQLPMRAALTHFMEGLLYNRDHDPAHNPYVKDYSLGDDEASNPQNNLDAGDYAIPVNAQTDAGMVRIFIPLQLGPSVQP